MGRIADFFDLLGPALSAAADAGAELARALSLHDPAIHGFLSDEDIAEMEAAGPDLYAGTDDPDGDFEPARGDEGEG